MPRSLFEKLIEHADNNPAHPAVVSANVSLSYGELAEAVIARAKLLQAAAVSDRAIVGIQCADEVEHLILCLTLAALGATSCTIPTHESEATCDRIILGCGATHVVGESGHIQAVGGGPDREPDKANNHCQDARFLFATSGTTGEPKLVIHHCSDIVAQAQRHISSGRERFACLASLEHNFAKRHRLYCIAAGATNIFLKNRQHSLVEQCLQMRVHVLHISVFQAQELLATPNIGALSVLRLKLGGSHASQALRKQLREQVTRELQAGYGTTETGAIAFTDPQDSGAGDSVGKALSGIEIFAVSPDRKQLPAGERGELVIRCAGMFRGYLGRPGLTAERLKDDHFYTGDIGYLDQEQRIFVCGRSDDMFVFNSMNILPQDIESVIRQHPAIADVAVIPKPSQVHGNIPVALIKFAKNHKQRLPEIEKFVKQRVGVRSPRQYIIVDEIPKNTGGKLLRQGAKLLSNKNNELRGQIIALLNESTRKKLKPAHISAFSSGDTDLSLRDLDMDSLDRMEFLIALETTFDIVITPQEMANFRYLGNVVSRILTPAPQGQHQENHSLPGDRPFREIQPEESAPYAVRLLQRLIGCSGTTVQLTRSLSQLGDRLTPADIDHLRDWHQSGLLIPDSAADLKKQTIFQWLHESITLMSKSGKSNPEPYTVKKVAPSVLHFTGPGVREEKTLVVCFPPAGGRNLMMANFVLLQHSNAAKLDVVVVSDPLNNSDALGLPRPSTHIIQASRWLADRRWFQEYKQIRTVGFSGGAYLALISGLVLHAELAVSICGRFYSKQHPIKNMDRFIKAWRANRRRGNTKLIFSYANDSARDQKYVRLITPITGGAQVAIESTTGRIGHGVLEHLLEHGALTAFLKQTIFTDNDNKPIENFIINAAEYQAASPN